MCDVSKCRDAIFKSYYMEQFVDFVSSMWAHASKSFMDFFSFYSRHVWILYSKYLENHVNHLMNSDIVQRYIECFEFVEGKVHVFLYFTKKDSPRIIRKIGREIQYLGYFVHWKGEQLVTHLAAITHRGISSSGVKNVEKVHLEYFFRGTFAVLCLSTLLVLRKAIWSSLVRILKFCLYLLLTPYWIFTKPFRLLYGLICYFL